MLDQPLRRCSNIKTSSFQRAVFAGKDENIRSFLYTVYRVNVFSSEISIMIYFTVKCLDTTYLAYFGYKQVKCSIHVFCKLHVFL